MSKHTHGHDHDHTPNINDLGLQADLAMWTRKPVERRQILKLGVLGIGVLLAGCGSAANAISQATSAVAPTTSTAPTATSAATTTTTTTTTAAGTTAVGTATAVTTAVAEIPKETAGPYPADGSQASRQNLNVLTASGIVRRDIRTSLATGNVAAGIPTTIELTLVDVTNGYAPPGRLRGLSVALRPRWQLLDV